MNDLINLSGTSIEEWTPPAPVDFTADPPKWLGVTYPGVEKDIARDLFAVIFWDMNAHQAKSGIVYDLQDNVVKARLVSEAILRATERSQGLQGDMQRAMYELIYIAKQTGAWQMGLYEYATLEEWLKSRLPDLEGSGELYDIKFLLDHLFPLLEEIGDTFQPSNLLKMQEEWSKTRASIPYMRGLYNEYIAAAQVFDTKIEKKKKEKDKLVKKKATLEPASPEDQRITLEIGIIETEIRKVEAEKGPATEKALAIFVEGIEKTLNVIADPEVSVRAGEKNISTELRGMRQPERKLYSGYVATMRERTIFVFSVPNRLQRAIETALKYIMQFKMTDPSQLTRDVSEMYLLAKDDEASDE